MLYWVQTRQCAG